MIWNDAMLHWWASSGGVTPFAPALVKPASLDLRLGNKIRVTKQCWDLYTKCIVNKSTSPDELWDAPFEFETVTLNPGDFVLCHSMEYTVLPDGACAALYSKSSTGRLGLEHLHAGYGDPGFAGQWTFEFKNVAPWPIQLVAGESYVQLVLMTMLEAPERTYQQTGHYNGQTGPEPHRVPKP